MQSFDPRQTPQAAAALIGDVTPDGARDLLASMDASVDAECRAPGTHGWAAMAEAPPGHLPAWLVVSHFLFDSWVHEYDLALPRHEYPPVDRLEAEVVVGYLRAAQWSRAG